MVVPPGTWVTGTLILRSHVNLHLMNGAVLKGSPRREDYGPGGRARGLLYAFNEENISITGSGEINGNGSRFMTPERPHIAADFDRAVTRQGAAYLREGDPFPDGPIGFDSRPGMMVVLAFCENVRLENVRLVDSPSWTVRFAECEDVLVRGVTIRNNLLIPNSDGIHCTTSRNVRISDCDIQAGDDAIIATGFRWEDEGDGVTAPPEGSPPRGNRSGIAENMVVSNCVLQSRSAGVRVGHGAALIRNLSFANLVIHDSNRGLGVFARDAADIENVTFDNITIQNRIHTGHWWGKGEPIHVSAISAEAGRPSGVVRNVRFSNISAVSEAGIVLWAEEMGTIEDVELDRVRLRIRPGEHVAGHGGNFDLRPAHATARAVFAHDVPGLFARGVNGLTISRFNLHWEEGLLPFHTYGIECEAVARLSIDSASRFSSRPGSGLPALVER